MRVRVVPAQGCMYSYEYEKRHTHANASMKLSRERLLFLCL